ncbi:MAG: Hpt domain-containing protein, partial [Burkholderiaceae bacterium]|nr:Hpt domain-containing protein [Burkholderiaceae bacterium]
MNTSHQADGRADAAATAGDLGSLAWVLGETRQSIESASKLLKRFARESQALRDASMGSPDASALRLARQQLHQAVGALEMVGQPIAARMVRGMEAAVQQWLQRPDKCQESGVATLVRAGFALMDYLEGQLRERARPALGLFRQFRQVQELAGAERIHPADLWDGVWRWVDPATPPVAQTLSYTPETRTLMDQLVLKIVRHADVPAAAELARISLALAGAETAYQPCIFWKLCGAFFEALGQQLTPLDIYARRTASRVLVQYASLACGDLVVSERLAMDLLFFCAHVRPFAASAAPTLAAVRQAWELEGQLAVDYEQQVFGLYDQALLAQARRRVEAMKESWSALAGGDLTRLKMCVGQFELLTESLDKLYENGNPLSLALTRVAGQIRQSGCAPSPELAMETATAVLFLEASFADFEPGEASFSSRMQQLAERLERVCDGAPPLPLESWMEDLYRSVNDRQTIGTVVGELHHSLGEIEQQLDQFFRNPADKTVLEPVPARITQLSAVLSVLGLDQAVLAVGHIGDAVNELLASAASGEEMQACGVFDRIGDSLGALGFEIDMLGYQPALAGKQSVDDTERGRLRPVAQATEADDAPAHSDADEPPPSGGTLPEQAGHSATLALIEEGWAPAKPVVRAVAPPPPPATPADDAAALDDEDDLQEIFLQEAREVIGGAGEALRMLCDRPVDREQQTILRRAFHTLKGSARLVGLTEFGAAAWSMEQLLNVWLAEQKPVTAELSSLAREALDGFARWIDDVAAQRADAWRAAPFSKAADALRIAGQRVPLEALPDSTVPAATAVPPDAVAQEDAAPPVAAATPDDARPTLRGLDLPDLELPELEAAAEPVPDQA